jgi:diguanylate cyclase (GGDEF)-like protein
MIPLLVLLGVLTPLLALGLLGVGLLLHRTRLRIRTLELEARHDPLTGLPNRRGLKAHWDLMQGERALLLIDLVGFKAVNDSHGHVVGDALLQQVAARLQALADPPGLMARWGGDEFVALVPASGATALARLLAAASAEPYDLSAKGGPREVSIGSRVGLSVGEADLERALDTATHGLMDAKAAA